MRKGNVRHRGRNVGTVILHSNDAGVEGLVLSITIFFCLLTYSSRAAYDKDTENLRNIYVTQMTVLKMQLLKVI